MHVNEIKASVRRFATAGALIAAVASVSFANAAIATEAYAKQTGKACTSCHTSPDGGAALTAAGEAFKANSYKLPAAAVGPKSSK